MREDARVGVIRGIEASTVFCVLVYLHVRICLLVEGFVALGTVEGECISAVGAVFASYTR